MSPITHCFIPHSLTTFSLPYACIRYVQGIMWDLAKMSSSDRKDQAQISRFHAITTNLSNVDYNSVGQMGKISNGLEGAIVQGTIPLILSNLLGAAAKSGDRKRKMTRIELCMHQRCYRVSTVSSSRTPTKSFAIKVTRLELSAIWQFRRQQCRMEAMCGNVFARLKGSSKNLTIPRHNYQSLRDAAKLGDMDKGESRSIQAEVHGDRGAQYERGQRTWVCRRGSQPPSFP